MIWTLIPNVSIKGQNKYLDIVTDLHIGVVENTQNTWKRAAPSPLNPKEDKIGKSFKCVLCTRWFIHITILLDM